MTHAESKYNWPRISSLQKYSSLNFLTPLSTCRVSTIRMFQKPDKSAYYILIHLYIHGHGVEKKVLHLVKGILLIKGEGV